MMHREPVEEIVRKLNSFPWGEAESISERADELAREHVRRMKAVVSHAGSAHRMSPNKAYADSQSAGYDAPGYNDLIDALFDMDKLRGLPSREHIILSVAACYFWEDDSMLGGLENPWVPVLQLYEMGYQSSFEESERQKSLEVIFFAKKRGLTNRIPTRLGPLPTKNPTAWRRDRRKSRSRPSSSGRRRDERWRT
jgi:hypothetical protein